MAKQIFDDQPKLDPAAAFAAACAAVHAVTEPGKLDTGLPGQVQKYQLHVNPQDKTLVKKNGRIKSTDRLAAGSPVHLSASQLPGGTFSITVDGACVHGTPAFYEWASMHELTVGGTPVPAEHVGT